jgi:hypothetical protein
MLMCIFLYFLFWLLSVKFILAVEILVDFFLLVFSVIRCIVSSPATNIIVNLFRLLRFLFQEFSVLMRGQLFVVI